MKKKQIFAYSFLVISMLFISPLFAIDNIWLDRDIIRNPMFKQPMFYISACNYDRALTELQKIVDQYPGTEYAVNAQLLKTEVYYILNENQKIIQEYQSMLQNYPNTKYWLIAQEAILYDRYQGETFETWLPIEDKLITDVGGESIYKIIQGKSINYDISQVMPQYRSVLAEFYTGIAAVFADDREQYDSAIKLWLFIRENFPNFTRYPVEDSLTGCVLKSKNINDYSQYQKDTTPPQITIDSPHHGNRVHGLKPRIQVALQDGDIMAAQVNLSKLIFTMDGQDVTDKMKVHSAVNTSAQPRVTFEKIKIVYKPESPLAVGSHTVYVKAEDYGGRSSEKTWTFTIVKPSLYRDGDDEDN